MFDQSKSKFDQLSVTEIMNEKTDHLHYSSLTGTLEDDMWIIDSGASSAYDMRRG
jgi:hypothetical protein